MKKTLSIIVLGCIGFATLAGCSAERSDEPVKVQRRFMSKDGPQEEKALKPR